MTVVSEDDPATPRGALQGGAASEATASAGMIAMVICRLRLVPKTVYDGLPLKAARFLFGSCLFLLQAETSHGFQFCIVCGQVPIVQFASKSLLAVHHLVHPAVAKVTTFETPKTQHFRDMAFQRGAIGTVVR
jgi:hypothetical protein